MERMKNDFPSFKDLHGKLLWCQVKQKGESLSLVSCKPWWFSNFFSRCKLNKNFLSDNSYSIKFILFKYTVQRDFFCIFSKLYEQYHYVIPKYFHHPQRNMSISSHFLFLWPQANTNVLSVCMYLLVLAFHLNEII